MYDALYMSEGHRAKDYIDALEYGVEDFEANFSDYEKLDSLNGWGLAKHALPFLQNVRKAFKENPEAVIHVSK